MVENISFLVVSSDLTLKAASDWAISISSLYMKSLSTALQIWENCETSVNFYPFPMHYVFSAASFVVSDLFVCYL